MVSTSWSKRAAWAAAIATKSQAEKGRIAHSTFTGIFLPRIYLLATANWKTGWKIYSLSGHGPKRQEEKNGCWATLGVYIIHYISWPLLSSWASSGLLLPFPSYFHSCQHWLSLEVPCICNTPSCHRPLLRIQLSPLFWFDSRTLLKQHFLRESSLIRSTLPFRCLSHACRWYHRCNYTFILCSHLIIFCPHNEVRV